MMAGLQGALPRQSATPGSKSYGTALAILSFLAVALIGVLLRPALPVDETRYLAVAWEMHQSGDWLVPTKNFAAYSDKPPLLFWAINLVWSLTGVSGIAARMVGPGFAALMLWQTGRLARALWPDQPGIDTRATLALLGLPVFAALGGLTMFDAALSVAVLAGLLALLRAGAGARLGWLCLGAAIALGVLAKGPVVLLHLLPAALTLPLWHPSRPSWRQGLRITGLGLLAGALILMLWLVPAAIHGGAEYRRAILWTQSAGRVAESFAHARPFWFYLALMPLLAFPWAWVLRLWPAAWQADWHQGGLRLCLIWSLAALTAFSLISGKQLHYLFPELPALALIAARLAGPAPVSLRLAVLPFGLAALAILLLGAGLLPAGPALADLHPSSTLTAVALILLAVIWAALTAPGLVGGAILSLGLVLSANLVVGLTDLGRRYDTAAIAAVIAPRQDRGIAWIDGRYSAEFNFAGRLTRPVDLPDPAELPAWIAAHPGGVILGTSTSPGPGWRPALHLPFRNKIHAIWLVPDHPMPEVKP
jgi:4-amino-4-deoxy-L-arabinose transferase-like glycosyltransferase